ncbi:MAG: helix-turn-helix transcriptional regulator [Cyclobacteriaceae bacterium]|nr:helix-turn-helix transcriptional regulator [Cyclobacteriaceae bacterium HetDA_MAG_MS6]
MNPNSFAEAIGVKGAVIYNIIKGRRNKPSFDVLQKILGAYQSISTEWLLKGEGSVWSQPATTLEDINVLEEPQYARIEQRIMGLLTELRLHDANNPLIDELEELVNHLLKENGEQKTKILALYEKQEGLVDLLRDRLNLRI